MPITYGEFARDVRQEYGVDIAMPDEISGAHYDDYYPDGNDGWHRALCDAAAMMQLDPQQRLTHEVIPASLVDESNIAARALLTVINTSLTRQPPAGRYNQFDRLGGWGLPYRCAMAESYMDDTFLAMLEPEEKVVLDNEAELGWTIIAENDQAVGVIKSFGERNGLFFDPCVLDGVTYPAGSFYSASGSPKTYPVAGLKSVIDIAEVRALNFARMSAFALSPEERPHQFAKVFETDYSTELLQTHTLEQLRTIADRAIPATRALRES